jgi:succinate dehydrogenase / fumarate reductase cytochrome b subunit
MALSGTFAIFFLIMHLLGNLSIFAGQEVVNSYALFLHSMPKVLWIFRILLIVSIIAHIVSAIKLNAKNRFANNIKYKKHTIVKASLQSRTMMLGGFTILFFILYHLAHFTLSIVDPGYENLIDVKGRHDVYNMLIAGFQNIYIVVFYVLAQFFLGLHLSHGFFSIAQTLGLTSGKLSVYLKYGGSALSIIIVCLYASIPLSVAIGAITYAH